MKLPQRFFAVQQHRVQHADLGFQLRHRGTLPLQLRQLDLDDVHLHRRVGIHPRRVGQVQRHPPQPAAQHGGHGQAAFHVCAQRGGELALVAGRQLEHMQGADMHGHLGCFKEQEGSVQAGELLHRGSCASAGQCGCGACMLGQRPPGQPRAHPDGVPGLLVRAAALACQAPAALTVKGRAATSCGRARSGGACARGCSWA